MSANIKASTDGTQAIIGVGGVDQMTVSNAGVVTANSFVGLNSSSVTATGSTTARTLANRFADVVNIQDFGAVGDGVADDTAAIQAAIFVARNSGVVGVNVGKSLFFPAGTYCITGLIIYPYQHLIFDPSAVLKMTVDGIAIRTSSVQSQIAPTGNIRRVILDGVRVDMNSKNGFGILLECCTNSVINNAWIVNVGSSNFNYSDGYSPLLAWASTGIVVKGITGTYGCYYNKITNANISSTTSSSNCGIWLGTSLTGENQRANFNQLNQITCASLGTGIDIALGGDNLIIQPEMSLCNVGIRVGNITYFTSNSRRNWIQQPYLESNSVAGIQLRSNADDTVIQGVASSSGTSTVIDDQGSSTSIFSANTDSISVNGYVRPYYGSMRFPSVQITDSDVNALDDYKEGTFVPNITCLGTAPTSVTYGTRNGTYTKIGRLVVAQISLEWSSMAGSPAGQMAITGLPYTPSSISVTAIYPQASVGGIGGAFVSGITLTDGTVPMYKFDGTTNVPWDYDTTAFIRCTLSYFTTT
jgi:hypothetical protein